MHDRWLCALLLVIGCTPVESGGSAPATGAKPPEVVKPVQPQASASVEPVRPIRPIRPIDPGWHDLEIGEGCSIRMARAPAALDMPIAWAPCSDESTGCLEASIESRDDRLGGYMLRGQRVGDAVYTILTLSGPSSRVMVSPLDGIPSMALELGPSEGCALGTIALADGGGVVEITYDHAAGYASRAYLQGPLHAGAQWTIAARLLRSDYPRFIADSIAMADGRLFVLGSGGPLRHYDTGTRRWLEVGQPHAGWACCMDAAGEVVTLLHTSIPEVALGSRLGADAVKLLEPPSGEGVTALALDGTRAVWNHGKGRDKNNYYQRIELWTGRLEPTPAIVDRRLVAELDGDGLTAPIVGDGLALTWTIEKGKPARPELVRLSDGARLEVPPIQLGRVLWLTKHEIAVQVGPPPGFIAPPIVRRLALDPDRTAPSRSSARPPR
jgi:hypothetical protein